MSQPFMGELRPFSFDWAPKGWAQSNGQLLAINQNQALFSLLGTTYGGDGRVTFALPNLQSRHPLHFGQGPGLSNYSLGQAAGSTAVTITTNQLPSHTHTATHAAAASATAPAGATWAPAADPIYGAAPVSDTKVAVNGAAAAGAIGLTGGSQAHVNEVPSLVVNICIALQGVFPSRN